MAFFSRSIQKIKNKTSSLYHGLVEDVLFKSEVFALFRNSKIGVLCLMVKTISGGRNLMFKKPPPMIVMSVYELDLALLYSPYIM